MCGTPSARRVGEQLRRARVRVAFLGGYDAAGQRFNGIVLHRALLAAGHESDYVVAEKRLDEPRIHELGPAWLKRWNRRVVRLETRLSRQSDLVPLGGAFRKTEAYRKADLLHLQLLHANSFFSLRELPRVANGRRPVLWTLHDPWITTGHCVHSMGCERWKTGCGACPDLTLSLPIRQDRTAANWAFKQKQLSRSRLHLVVASDWMQQRVAESPLLAGLPCTKIPFGVDTDVFRPIPKAEARRALGVPEDARPLAIRWAPHYLLKGTRYAEEALMRLPSGLVTDLICFDTPGGSEVERLQQQYRVTTIRNYSDPEPIATGLAAADAFLMPSLAETFGLMAVEAMACGTPPIVFEGTSLPAVIDAPRGGRAVEMASAAALAATIVELLSNPEALRSCRDEGLKRVQSLYTEHRYVESHLALYQRLLQT